MHIHIMKPSDEMRMYADKCEDDDPAAARLLREVADIMDIPYDK